MLPYNARICQFLTCLCSFASVSLSQETPSLRSSNASVRRRSQQQESLSSPNNSNSDQPQGRSLTNQLNLRGGSTIISAREGKIREMQSSLRVLQNQIEKYVTGVTEENERKLYSLQQRVMFYQQQIDIESMQLENDKRQQQRNRQREQEQSQTQRIFQQQPLNNQNNYVDNDEVRELCNRETMYSKLLWRLLQFAYIHSCGLAHVYVSLIFYLIVCLRCYLCFFISQRDLGYERVRVLRKCDDNKNVEYRPSTRSRVYSITVSIIHI